MRIVDQFTRPLPDGRIACEVCPRDCKLADGQRGLCYVRQNQGGHMVLVTDGLSSGFCVDPIEKKPLLHFLPGSAVLSFGTAGCNLACAFCQNHEISKSRAVETSSQRALPETIARAARQLGCESVAFTYNDPVIFFEYATDVAEACHALGIRTVAVTAGYMRKDPRAAFYRHLDAANVDLKAFTETFYHRHTASHLADVLDTLVYLKAATTVWFEITTLLIPGENDGAEEIDAMTKWLRRELGPDVPLHFTAFHPDHRMLDHPPTPKATLERARAQAIDNGLNHVYIGNCLDRHRQSSLCGICGTQVITRDSYVIVEYRLDPAGCCPTCRTPFPGRYGQAVGHWGRKRLPVNIEAFA